MSAPVPRVLTVAVQHPMRLAVRLDTAPGIEHVVNLAGWIRRGGAAFAVLKEPDTFARAAVGGYGGNVTWDEDEGEVAIDSVHLEALAAEQNPFTGVDARQWQDALGWSNEDVADVLGLDPATWQMMKDAATPLPASIARLCRAALRDPFIAEAHIAGAGQAAA